MAREGAKEAEAEEEAEAVAVVTKPDLIWNLRVKDRRSVSSITGETAWTVPRVVYYMCVTEGKRPVKPVTIPIKCQIIVNNG